MKNPVKGTLNLSKLVSILAITLQPHKEAENSTVHNLGTPKL